VTFSVVDADADADAGWYIFTIALPRQRPCKHATAIWAKWHTDVFGANTDLPVIY
jgi:hypothetical protein